MGPNTLKQSETLGEAAVQPDEPQHRIDPLEARIRVLERQVTQRAIEAAYMYIHSNWTLIRWFLVREQDRAGEGSEVALRARGAETTIRDFLPRNLRAVQFAEDPMAVAYQWRIETTVHLNRHGYTFFD
jgi:hypothetical protein